jgi:hypothetical protein
MVLTDMGSAAEARVLADRSADMARSRGLRPWATLSGIAQGLIMVDLGEVNKGLSWFQEHLNAWEREQGAFHCGEFCGLMVDRLLRAGWMQQAFDLVLHAQELYRDLSERMYAAELLRLRSRFRELEGDLDGAEAGYGEALARLPRNREPTGWPCAPRIRWVGSGWHVHNPALASRSSWCPC